MDIVRGVGICLVVLGHNPVCLQGGWAYAAIFSFHMPLFYFLSGYFHKEAASWKEEVVVRARKLLLPYFLTAFAYVLLKFTQNPVFFFQNELKPLLFGILWGSGGRGSIDRYMFWPPMWFLTSLFVTQLAYGALERSIFCKSRRIIRVITVLCIFGLGQYYLLEGGKGYLNFFGTTLILAENGLPYNLDIVPITLFYYWIGVESSRYIARHSNASLQFSSVPRLLFVWLLFALTIYMSWKFVPQFLAEGVMDLNLRNYGNQIGATVLALLGIYGMLCLGNVLEGSAPTFIQGILVYLGQFSLVILVFHHVFQKEALQRQPDWPGGWLVAFLVGILFPVLAAKFLMAKNKSLSRIYNIPLAKG